MKIFIDNEMTFILTKDLESQNYEKYINVIYHYMSKLIENRELEIE